jgi:pyrimidine-nucleoside phosphorylase
MPTLEKGRELAESMVEIGKLAGRQAVALLSDMNQPLGQAVGNALEVKEAIATLQGGGPDDFREHALEVATQLVLLGEAARDEKAARQLAESKLADGSALERFRALVAAQGGDVSYVDAPDKLPQAELVEEVAAPRSGYLKGIDARVVGETSVALGAGRAKKGDSIDLAVGIVVFRNVGDTGEEGEPLFTIHANDQAKLDKARPRLLAAHTWSEEPVEPLPLFYDIVK